MVILNLQGITFHPVVVLGTEHDFLFKSTSTYCVRQQAVLTVIVRDQLGDWGLRSQSPFVVRPIVVWILANCFPGNVDFFNQIMRGENFVKPFVGLADPSVFWGKNAAQFLHNPFKRGSLSGYFMGGQQFSMNFLIASSKRGWNQRPEKKYLKFFAAPSLLASLLQRIDFSRT